MSLIFNIPGLVFAVAALGIAYAIGGLVTGEWHGDNAVSFFVLGTLALAMDLGYRARRVHDSSAWRFVRPTAGGHILFIPIWVFGAIWIIMGGVDLATGRRHLRAQNDAFVQETIALLEQTTSALQNPPAADEAARSDDLLDRSLDRIHQLADLYDRLDQSEKRRLDRKYGDRVNRLIEQIRLRSTR